MHKASTGMQKLDINKNLFINWLTFSKICLLTNLLCQLKKNTTKNVAEDFLQAPARLDFISHQTQAAAPKICDFVGEAPGGITESLWEDTSSKLPLLSRVGRNTQECISIMCDIITPHPGSPDVSTGTTL